MDSAPSHVDRAKLKLFQVSIYCSQETNLFRVLGHPNWAHDLNSEDQLVNLIL